MDFGTLLPPRSIEDVLAERVRLVIGGQVYDLPVLPIAENRAWKERMDLELGFLIVNISLKDDGDAILGLFDGSEALFLDLLQSYDRLDLFTPDEVERRGLTGLPPVEVLEAGLTPLGLVRAVLEVWRAARPLADIAEAGMMVEPPTSASPPPTSSWLQRMAGRLAGSSSN